MVILKKTVTLQGILKVEGKLTGMKNCYRRTVCKAAAGTTIFPEATRGMRSCHAKAPHPEADAAENQGNPLQNLDSQALNRRSCGQHQLISHEL